METASMPTNEKTFDRFVRIDEVQQRTGLSRPSIYRGMSEGWFPKQVRIGPRSVAWRESVLNRWQANPAGWAKT